LCESVDERSGFLNGEQRSWASFKHLGCKRFPQNPEHPVETERLHRDDFSQWIADVFHDHVLASDVRKVEQRYRLGHTRDLYNALAESIQARYELFPEIDDVQEVSATSSTA